MLKVVAVSKGYGGRAVIRELSLNWNEPGVRLVAGANGVGKSTLLAMLAGALEPDAGEIVLSGRSLSGGRDEALKRVSYGPAECPVFPFLTGREWLAFVRSLRGPWEREVFDELWEAFGLQDHERTRFDRMSLGTARKFMLLGAVAADTELLILDEPSNALDALSLAALQAVLRRQAEHRLIVLSCHESSQHEGFAVVPEHTLVLQ